MRDGSPFPLFQTPHVATEGVLNPTQHDKTAHPHVEAAQHGSRRQSNIFGDGTLKTRAILKFVGRQLAASEQR